MAMIPENPVVGGTVLRRAAIQSPNFATGVSGWSVNQDGSAEFNNLVIRNGQIISGTALFYSGPAAAGNLIGSIAAAAGTDSKGNAYLAGITSYDPILDQAANLANGAVTFYAAVSEAGPWTPLGQLLDGAWLEPSTSGLNLKVGVVPAQVQIAQALVDITTKLQVDAGVLIQASVGSLGGLLNVTEQLAAPGNPVILFRGQAATDRLFGIDAVGDTNRRLVINPGGVMNWGPGNAGQDCTLFRASANLLASDYLAFAATATTAEAWTAVTFVNSWANVAAGTPMQYRRVAAPDNCVQLIGDITAPAGIVAGQNITAALPLGFRPAHPQVISAVNATGPKVCYILITTGGVIQFEANAVAGDTIRIPGGNLIALTA